MKKIVETLKNIWRIEDLRTRILITILFVAIYRFGSTVVLPGIDSTALANLQKQTEGGLMSLLDMFSGGAFSQASIFALGIMPYITASIVIQLLAVAVPYFQKLQREGESGTRPLLDACHSHFPSPDLPHQPENADANFACLPRW